MLGGLVHETESGPQVSAAYTTAAAPTGGNNAGAAATTTAAGGPSTTTTTTTTSGVESSAVNSHLDSFFQGSRLTREDVLVVAAAFQMVAWIVLLWLEVRE